MTYERQVQINSVKDGSIVTRGSAATVHYTKDRRTLIPDAADFCAPNGYDHISTIAELLAYGETVILVPSQEYPSYNCDLHDVTDYERASIDTWEQK